MIDAVTRAPPVLMPVRRIDRMPRALIVVAGSLAGCVVLAAAMTHLRAAPSAAPMGPPRFGEETRPRLEDLFTPIVDWSGNGHDSASARSAPEASR